MQSLEAVPACWLSLCLCQVTFPTTRSPFLPPGPVPLGAGSTEAMSSPGRSHSKWKLLNGSSSHTYLSIQLQGVGSLTNHFGKKMKLS